MPTPWFGGSNVLLNGVHTGADDVYDRVSAVRDSSFQAPLTSSSPLPCPMAETPGIDWAEE